MTRTKWIYVVGAVCTLFSLTACLKTRAQLKQDAQQEEKDTKGVSAQPIQEVHPQGQYVIEEVKSELTAIEGRLEDVERNQKDQPKVPTVDVETVRKLEERVNEIESQQEKILAELKGMQEATPAMEPADLLAQIRSHIKKEDYEAALTQVTSFLKSAKGKNAEEALLLKGECLYKLKQYKKAIVEFSKFQEKFSHSTHVPEALYKIGLSFDALSMKDDAKGFYQEIVEKYPKSPEAKKAKKKIK